MHDRQLFWPNCLIIPCFIAFIFVACFGDSTPAAQAGVPRLVKFSGTLRDADGRPRTGVVGVLFSIYRESEGGASLWQETQNVTLETQGRYTVLLGAMQAGGLPANVFANDEPRWIGVQPLVPGEPERPRLQLVSVPYALKAADADTLGGLPASAFLKAGDGTGGIPAAVAIASTSEGTTGIRSLLLNSGERPVTTPGATSNAIPKSATSTSIVDSQISDSNGVVGIQNLENVRYADRFSGADCGAKINAADAALGASHGEIWVNQLCGSNWSTTVRLGSGHTLRFIQGGQYVGAAIPQMIAAIGSPMGHKANIHVVGSGIGQTYLLAPRGGRQVGSLLQFAYCDDCSVENLTADGNNNTTVVLVDEMNTRFRARNLRLLADTAFNPNHDYCIHIRGSQFGTYDGLDLTGGSQDAIDIGLGPFGAPTQAAQWNHFSNIVAHDSPWNGIDLGGWPSLIVQNNTFTNITVIRNGTFTGSSDDRYGLNLNYASYNQFQGVKAWNNQRSGIRISAGTGNVFTGIDSQQNGLAGPNAGDAIRLENATSKDPNYGNIFVGNVRSWGSNFAIQTKGKHTSYNVFNLEIGSSPIRMANTNDILHIVRTVAGMESVSGLDFSLASFASCPAAPGIANVANVGICLSGPVRVNGELQVAGAISAGAKNFKIDHPLDPANRYLVHASIESSEMMNVYAGNVTLDEKGEAMVQLPPWFEALNRDFRYQLSCVGSFAPVYVAQEITNHSFRIAGGLPGLKVSWQVSGVRHDPYATAHPLVVEQNKQASDGAESGAKE